MDRARRVYLVLWWNWVGFTQSYLLCQVLGEDQLSVKHNKPGVRANERLEQLRIRARRHRAPFSELDDYVAISSDHGLAEGALKLDGLDGATKMRLGEPVALRPCCRVV